MATVNCSAKNPLPFQLNSNSSEDCSPSFTVETFVSAPRKQTYLLWHWDRNSGRSSQCSVHGNYNSINMKINFQPESNACDDPVSVTREVSHKKLHDTPVSKTYSLTLHVFLIKIFIHRHVRDFLVRSKINFILLGLVSRFLSFRKMSKIYILFILMLLACGSNPTLGNVTRSCPSNCSCSAVPTPTLASEKWASLMPSAFLLHPKLFQNFSNTLEPSKPLQESTTSEHASQATQHKRSLTIRRRRELRRVGYTQRGPPIQENIIDLSPSFPAEPSGGNSIHSLATSNFDSVHKRLQENRRQRISSGASEGQPVYDYLDSDSNIVPEVISEQIPDLYEGSVYPSMKLNEDFQWTDEAEIGVTYSNQSSGEDDLQLPIAMVCEAGSYFAVPLGDEHFVHSMVVSLDLSFNNITNLTSSSLAEYSALRYLSVRHNGLAHVGDLAFEAQPDLDTLDLSQNLLSSVPPAVRRCPQLRLLLLAENEIRFLSETALQGLRALQWVDLRSNPLLTVHHRAFSDLPVLNKLILKETRELTRLPEVNSERLEVLGVDRAALMTVPDGLCRRHPSLRSLNLHLNALKELPDLSQCHRLKLLDLSNNGIEELHEGAFRDTEELQDLLLQHNRITALPPLAFAGLQQLQVLNLEYNHISYLHPDAFLPLKKLEDLNLGNNVFPELPNRGLEHVLHLKVHNNRHLRQFPDPQSFPSVVSLVLSYAYHCCPFLNMDVALDNGRPGTDSLSRSKPPPRIHEDVVFNLEGLQRHDPRLWNHSHPGWPSTTTISATSNTTKAPPPPIIGHSLRSTAPHPPSSTPTTADDHDHHRDWMQLEGADSNLDDEELHNQHAIQCIPQPGPFMPCRDLFDWWTLRCGVWLVFLLALMGNGVVVVVLIAAYAKMDVPRFLVTNLAMADFLMGVYLGFLAVVDASTLGEFRMYAIPWQMSAGCQLAGFLGVLSSELSVYTLTVITLERNYAIIHAMNLNKRLSLRHAAYIMAIGWMFALTMAVLPLTGVSDYRKFAVCLPFETDGAGLGYVVFLMVINGVAFMILMGCYLKIYCAIRGSQAWNSNDSRIAKRMALLVFTDFICWAPIAFFSLSAAYGLQLISLEEAKVFTVFILPLNSCCNPFLYALLTKQFKKDCVMLCKAIEESRVTRGIGRCRHSSNFSNRQTPVNTNSALDSKSREACSCGIVDKKRSRPCQVVDFICCHKTRLSAGTYSKGHRRNLSPKKEVGRSTTSAASWNWRGTWRATQKPGPLRLLDIRKPASLDLTRKSSQESSLSSSRHDSSTASTATWRVSRSSVSSDASKTDSSSRTGSQREDSRTGSVTRHPGRGGSKPRLQRQRAIEKDAQGTSRLNCPVHPREELSCVYEQASIEEAAEIKVIPSPRFSHRRSLSDGLLFCTIAATQPISGVQSNPVALFAISPTVLPMTPEIVSQDSISHESESEKPGLLETHFPLDNDDQDESAPKEASPLI
ncbi:uncharacterized protein LOC108680486 isoform X2 [Hyalella azteca]|uniref:Uncharacterized protein LOC108680486 isoform X2 n=1 Tax=Hyalella azteca TaxID=294128 RepID=A0A979FX89_HYAAZ|nr:uncharacterized protein LOC108680486 isoform X2 [Hyalella azteca]